MTNKKKSPQDDIVETIAVVAGEPAPVAKREAPPALTTTQVRRLGALSVQDEESIQIDNVLADQRNFYESASKEELIKTLLERDKTAMLEGRQLARGQIQGNLLREIMRGILLSCDHATLRRIGDASKTGQVESILEMLGAEKADARQLKLHGSTLGKLDDASATVQRLTLADEEPARLAGTGAAALDAIKADFDQAQQILQQQEADRQSEK